MRAVEIWNEWQMAYLFISKDISEDDLCGNNPPDVLSHQGDFVC